MEQQTGKIIIYQLFTRLFGNDNATNTANGTIEENGCGKLSAFNAKALKAIKELGVSHVWYTGLIEHATQTDYAAFGIRRDHPGMVKGKAGSPYAIKDYYDIDPDLADNVTERRKEFEALVARTHRAGLKVIIDFVPNHVARQYASDAKPEGVADLGEKDNAHTTFYQENNFYYIPGQALEPQFDTRSEGERYLENPAKVTGNDCFSARPSITDWYETVKLNYGVDYLSGHTRHFDPIPDTWKKMLEILLFWASKKIDAFRCDMVEMVPVEFWNWAIPQVKARYPEILFIAEVYNPAEYRNYIFTGKFDYLYDKVGLYDTLRAVICAMQTTQAITGCWQSLEGIQDKMLNFLENHDEQRIASDFFAGDPLKALPAMLVAATMNVNPVMIYFGQELGEKGMDAEGFSGLDGRTTIFDYWSVESIRKWRNGGKYTLSLLTEEQKHLRAYYVKLLQMCRREVALSKGVFYDLMYANGNNPRFNADRQYAFFRKAEKELLLIVANFDPEEKDVAIHLPRHAFDYLKIKQGMYRQVEELLSGEKLDINLSAEAAVALKLPGYSGVIVKITPTCLLEKELSK